MCNEFNSGLFPSYIWKQFRAMHIAETRERRKLNLLEENKKLNYVK